MNHTAINPAWQKKLTQLYAADRRYSNLVDKHQVALDALDPESDRYHDLAARQEDIQAFAGRTWWTTTSTTQRSLGASSRPTARPTRRTTATSHI